MPRKSRLQPLSIPLHVIARGVQGRPIFESASSKQHLLGVLAEVAADRSWDILDWVVMTNHFHLVLELREPTLSEGMKRLAGLHAQKWNWREQERGHVYMGRFRSIVVADRPYLVNVIRYVDLNPVRAGLCGHPTEYVWSGYAANAGLRAPEPFHHAGLGLRAVSTHEDVETARGRYRRFVCMKIPAWAKRGHEFEERPGLYDILRPGRFETWAEAIDVWWYTTGDIAALYGVTTQAVRDWIKGGVPPRPLPMMSRLP